MKHKLMVISIIMGALLGGNVLVNAHVTPEIGQQSLRTPVKDADYAFQGVVTKVEYGLSDTIPQLPHTFVTFQVEKFLKGQFNQRSVTLRFIGGPDNKGHFLTVTGIPLFDVGDRDVLFVKGNGKSWCPLAQCEFGRFRIINNQVFTDDGRPILQKEQEQLGYGKPQELEEVITNKIGNAVLQQVSSNEKANQGDSLDSTEGIVSFQEQQASLPSLQPSQFELLIKNQVLQLTSSGELQPRQFVLSVDSNASFSTPAPKPVAPSQISAPQIQPTVPSSEADRKELEMLQQNQGNPVFPNSKPRI